MRFRCIPTSPTRRYLAISLIVLALGVFTALPTLMLLVQELIDAREIAQRYDSYDPPLLGNWAFGNDVFGWLLTISVALIASSFVFFFVAMRVWYRTGNGRKALGLFLAACRALPTPRRFGIRSLLMLLTCSAIGFATCQYYSASARYKRDGDINTLRQLLSTQIEAGDTIAQVASILGHGNTDDGDHLQRLLDWKAGPLYDPRAFAPDGLQKGDVFVRYSAIPKTSYSLQFRNDILINFDPARFVGPDDTIAVLSR